MLLQLPARVLRSGAGTGWRDAERYCAVLLPATQACNQTTVLIISLPLTVSKALYSYQELPLPCPTGMGKYQLPVLWMGSCNGERQFDVMFHNTEKHSEKQEKEKASSSSCTHSQQLKNGFVR